ncbi:hypothetical protein [Gluconobacter japonicus]|uniref:hypothetical protein n=1 Tax=Gluconobacter japonicus TaxID=376620 RepID=UPI0039E78B63
MSKLAVQTTEKNDQSHDLKLPELPPRCVWQSDGTVLMTLEKTISLKGSNNAGPNTVEITELVFQDLDGGALMDMSAYLTSGLRMGFLIGVSTGHTGPVGEKVVRAIKGRDYRRAEKIVDIFTDGGLTIGTSV